MAKSVGELIQKFHTKKMIFNTKNVFLNIFHCSNHRAKFEISSSLPLYLLLYNNLNYNFK